MDKHISAIVLAAGKGTRLKSKNLNKVTLPLGNKPMILHTINLLDTLHVHPVVVVVGFAKESVISALCDKPVVFAEQKEQLGVAHAVFTGLKKIPQEVASVLILNGDDSAFFPIETIKQLIEMHESAKASLTFLTIHMDKPLGLGRIVREDGKPVGIVEEIDANEKQRNIKEINAGCYVANVSFLKKYLPKIKKSGVTLEYYLTDIVALAVKNNESVQALYEEKFLWRGINTQKELEEAQRLFSQQK
ncbi:MAG: NTP transferase domain-containing protein [Candidatus Levybacteria bacterium]|nr:NTP transferase domain-containing protein [Candidatus Levybacteria bacterium]